MGLCARTMDRVGKGGGGRNAERSGALTLASAAGLLKADAAAGIREQG